MPYGQTGRQVRTYQYRALVPRGGWDTALDQHRLRTRFWNALVEIEHDRREQREAIIAAHTGVIEDDDAEREARRIAFQDDTVKARLRKANAERSQRQRETRQAFAADGLYWGNYLDVEADWMTACRNRDAPRFHRYDPREGKVAVPTTNGFPVANLGTDTRVRLEPIERWSERAGKKHARARLLRLRLGSDPPRSRNPIWFDLPVILHRPLPEDGIVRETHVTWRRRATKTIYSVSFVVERPTAAPTNGEGPAVAVDLAWRMIDGELRAGYWLGEDGECGDLRLNQRWLAGMDKIDDLRSIRDQHLNAMQPALITWIDHAPGVPEWLQEERSTMTQWRAAARFAALAPRWRERRFAGDNTGYTLLEQWRQRDKHLYEYQEHYRAQLLANRREQYRILAARLSRRYSTLVVEDFDLRQVTRRADNGLHDAARHQRFLVAPSELRSALVNAFQRDHGTESVMTMPAEYTTVACWQCGRIDETYDPATTLSQSCPGCGAAWDQDYNAARNLLSRADLSLTSDPGEVRAS